MIKIILIGRRSFGVMEIVKRKVDWGRKTVKWERSELRNISTVLSQTKDQAFIQTSTIPTSKS
jgi:hypothetical protein